MQAHHTARDIFLTELQVKDDPGCLVRPVTVCPPAELDQHTEGDVFVCDHQYHTGCSGSISTWSREFTTHSVYHIIAA